MRAYAPPVYLDGRVRVATRQRNARGEGGKLRDGLLAGLSASSNAPAARTTWARPGQRESRSLRRRYTRTSPMARRSSTLVQQTFEHQLSAMRQARDDSPPAGRLFAVCRYHIRFGVEQPERYLPALRATQKAGADAELSDDSSRLMYPKGAEAFDLLVEAVAQSRDGGGSAAEDAALLWASLHGYVTLRASSPGFPWFADEEHVCRALIPLRATASTPWARLCRRQLSSVQRLPGRIAQVDLITAESESMATCPKCWNP